MPRQLEVDSEAVVRATHVASSLSGENVIDIGRAHPDSCSATDETDWKTRWRKGCGNEIFD